jgi:hypothetical protein
MDSSWTSVPRCAWAVAKFAKERRANVKLARKIAVF